MPGYEPFSFDPKYANENIDKRYERLLREFDAKFLQHLVELHEQAAAKGEDDVALKDFKKCIAQYEQQMRILRETIAFFSKETLKEHPDNNLLTVGGYPGKAYLIELLARLSKTIDEPTNDENKIQLFNLINEIPEDTQGYWRQVKVGVIIFLTAALMLGAILGTIALFPPAVAPHLAGLTAVSLGMVPAVLGACLAREELNDIFRTSKAKEVKAIGTTKEHAFFSPSDAAQDKQVVNKKNQIS